MAMLQYVETTNDPTIPANATQLTQVGPSWDDFSTFYKTANHWDYPVDADAIARRESAKKAGDIFNNHGSRQSMDILAEEMADKWSFGGSPNVDTSVMVPPKTSFSNFASKMVETGDSPTASQRMATFLEEPEQHCDAEDTDRDSNSEYSADAESKEREEIETELELRDLGKDDEIARLKAENERLKLRNSALRKTLNKAQQYRRKSAVAVKNLMAIQNTQKPQTDEELARAAETEAEQESEALVNLRIQQQIQQAIAAFQSEFGAELDAELENIESFQYAEPLHGHDVDVLDHGASPLSQPITNQLTGMQRQNTSADHSAIKKPSAVKAVGIASNFCFKFTDAHSHPATPGTPATPTPVPVEENVSADEVDGDMDVTPEVLPAAIETARDSVMHNAMSVHMYPTPGGPEFAQIGSSEKTPSPRAADEAVEVAQTEVDSARESEMAAMQSRLNELSEQMAALMTRVEELTHRNQDLERSKMTLIESTSRAMDEYRDNLKRLSRTNHALLSRLEMDR